MEENEKNEKQKRIKIPSCTKSRSQICFEVNHLFEIISNGEY